MKSSFEKLGGGLSSGVLRTSYLIRRYIQP